LSVSRSSGSLAIRSLGVAAALALLFAITIPPFVGSATLVEKISPFLSGMMQGVALAQYRGLAMVLGSVGFLLLVIGILLGLVFFWFRRGVMKARIGMLLCVIGLLMITAFLFDYSPDNLLKILIPVQVGIWPSLAFYGTGYFIAWIAVIVGLTCTKTRPMQAVSYAPAPKTEQFQVPAPMIPTGYKALDGMLNGGLPLGLSIVLTGPPCDEKNLILRRFLETNLGSGRECIFISTSLDRVREMLSKHKNLHVILCNPQAETIAAPFPEVVKIKSVDSLTQLNLEYDIAAGRLSSGRPSILCLEILDDVLLEHHGATRRWLMDILGRGKGVQMTCLATLNPAMHSAQELQAILETFDGHIDLYEAEVQVRPKLIQVRKLGGRTFIDSEVRVEKDRI
jgi:archaellum biogenesis ATPase FlaH